MSETDEYCRKSDVYVYLTAYYHHTTAGQHLSLREAISRIPKVTEVREVVRCEDCKWNDTTNCQIVSSLYGLKDHDFCSYGER